MAMMRIDRPFEVLLVDDDEGNAFLLRQASGQSEVEVKLHTVCNGEEGLAFLRKEGPYAAAPTPDLVLLDINMPVMNGREMLAALVADPSLRGLPVVVFTSSGDGKDVDSLYGLRCSTYIVKPRDFDGLEKVVDLIYRYWFTVAALPHRDR
jgi:CheY-like chemotaxis protein